jgi:hypothetical protein
MYGHVTTYRRDLGVGIISAEDGRKYRFQRGSLINLRPDLLGVEVDFELSGRTPKDIIVLAGSPYAVFGAPAETVAETIFESEPVFVFRAAA